MISQVWSYQSRFQFRSGRKGWPFGILGAVCRTGATLRPVQAIFSKVQMSTFKSRETSFSCSIWYSCLSMSQFTTLYVQPSFATHNTEHRTQNTEHRTHNTHTSHLASRISHLTSHISTTQPHNTCACIALSGVSFRHYLVLCLRSMDIALVVRAQQAVQWSGKADGARRAEPHQER